jgi:hypothetical protein
MTKNTASEYHIDSKEKMMETAGIIRTTPKRIKTRFNKTSNFVQF